MKIIVLGAGLVGGPMALDLAADERFEVTVADRDADALSTLEGCLGLSTAATDFADPSSVARLVADYDLILGAEPSHLSYRLLEAMIPVGRPIVDIAFLPEDPFGLDALAREHGIPVLVDCGVFPGMGSVLIGRANRVLDRLENVIVYVGGLPEERRPPFEYATVFSPRDVFELYTRPARMRENGSLVERPALSEPELIDLPGVETLEAFNTDGLRSLLTTVDVPNIKEKTLRYPGHIDKMGLLRDCGFLDTEPMQVAGQAVCPVDLAAELLFPMWELQPGDRELTVMRVLIDGVEKGRPVRWTYDLLDRTDHEGGVTSMARTTGYTATMAVRALADGLYTEPGVSPPEYLGRVPGCTSYLLKGLEERGIDYRESREHRPASGS